MFKQIVSCVEIVDKLRINNRKKCAQSSTAQRQLQTKLSLVVDKLSISPQRRTHFISKLSTAKLTSFLSVKQLVLPSFHSTYYYQDELKTYKG